VSTQARDLEIAEHIGLVHHVARHYRSHAEFEDLIQVGMEGLIFAVDHFDSELGNEFSTYAVPCIRGAIQHHLRDRTSSIRIPGRLQELALKVSRAVDELTQMHSRSPTIPTIAAHLDISIENVLAALEVNHTRSMMSTDDERIRIAESSLDDSNLEDFENRESVLQALRALPKLEQRVVLLRFYENLTQTQIAKELNISQMQVSRILARTLVTLRSALTSL
jgi:RNA polymerase sigma-B factor